MANTSDQLRSKLEAAFPGYDVHLEGVGLLFDELAPYEFVLTSPEGKKAKFRTSVTADDVVAYFKKAFK